MNFLVRILLVHDIPLMSNLLSAALVNEEGIHIVGSAASVDEALRWVESENIDVILLSIRLPDQGALRLIKAVTSMYPGVAIVVLGISDQPDNVLRYVEAGVAGYVSKDNSVDDLLNIIRNIHDGRADISPEVAAAMMKRISELSKMFSSLDQKVFDNAGLTSRELEILTMLGKHLTNQEIAEDLVIEVGTVKNHVHNILNKLNVSSREDAAAYLALVRTKRNQ